MNHQVASPSPKVSEFWNRLAKQKDEWVQSWKEKIRKAPLASVISAIVAGSILHFIPLGRIIGGVFRMALKLIKPALLIFGYCKFQSVLGSFSKREIDETTIEPLLDSPKGPPPS